MKHATTKQDHPVWCRNYPENPGAQGDCKDEHVGRDYRLDAGETFAYTISAEASEWVHCGPSSGRIRLTIIEQESTDATAHAYLTLDELDRLKDLLEQVAPCLRLSDIRG